MWLLLWLSGLSVAICYQPHNWRVRKGQLFAAGSDSTSRTLLSRTLFSLTETLGRVVGSPQGEDLKNSKKGPGSSASNLEEIGQQIKEEYEALFWVTGNMDTSLWADDCYFADPFSSFGGPGAPGSTLRFEANAKNLGKLVLKPKSRVTSYEVDEQEYSVKIGWTFQSKLKLPWRPVLAAAGVTTHILSKDTLLIEKYLETWKSRPWDVVKRLFVPTPREEEGGGGEAWRG